jgi:HlyD family secretion protein
VKLGEDAQVRIDAYPNQTFDAVVTEVGGSPITKLSQNEATKFKVKVQIKNPPLTIKPGLSAQADIFTGRQNQALVIPIQALVMKEAKPSADAAKGADTGKSKNAPSKDEEGAFLLEKGKVHFVALKTGLMGELNVQVIEGLKGGETLITGPFKVLRGLKDGDLVQVDKSKKKDAKQDEKK